MRVLVWGIVVIHFILNGICWCASLSDKQKSSRKYKLFEAIASNDVKTVKKIARGFLSPVVKRDAQGETALMKAVDGGSVEMVQLLLKIDKVKKTICDVSNDSRSALVRAVEKDFFDIAELLLQNGAAEELAKEQEDNSDTIFTKAIRSGHNDIVMLNLLLEYGAKPSGEDLVAAISNGNIEIVNMILDQGVNANSEGRWDFPTVRAAKEGRLDMLKLLCDRGAILLTHRVSYTDELEAALRYGHSDVVEYLLDKGVISMSSVRRTCENVEKVVWLLDLLDRRSDSSEYQKKNCCVAIFESAFPENIEVMKLLIDRTKGQVIHWDSSGGRSLLGYILHHHRCFDTSKKKRYEEEERASRWGYDYLSGYVKEEVFVKLVKSLLRYKNCVGDNAFGIMLGWAIEHNYSKAAKVIRDSVKVKPRIRKKPVLIGRLDDSDNYY